MTERNPKDEERVEEVEDLDVPESESEEVKGGLRLRGIKGESKDTKHANEIEIH